MSAKSPSERKGSDGAPLSPSRFGAWPALLGAVVLGAVGLFAALRSPARPPPPAAPAHTGESLAPALPSLPVNLPSSAPATATLAPPTSGAAEPPAVGPQKPPLTLEEKVELASRHIGVLEHRASSLEEEIARAEHDGDGDLAEKKRIRLTRLRAHIASLRADVAAGREPDSP